MAQNIYIKAAVTICVRRCCNGRRAASPPSGRDGETLVLYFYFVVDSRVSSRNLPTKRCCRVFYSFILSKQDAGADVTSVSGSGMFEKLPEAGTGSYYQ